MEVSLSATPDMAAATGLFRSAQTPTDVTPVRLRWTCATHLLDRFLTPVSILKAA
jgi:hypothetical protein